MSGKYKEVSINMASEKITVLSPRGTPSPIQMVAMAPRLDSLEGKTIYISWT
jgi:hypothetical protein